MSIHDIAITMMDDTTMPLSAHAGRVLLVVNVASECGFTPQYAGLEQLFRENHARGLVVLGVPCNQFGGQEPGGPDQIHEFCSSTYGVSFPLAGKVDVNGPDRHPLFARLTEVADPEGDAGDVRWNFEKFLVDPSGVPVARFRTATAPEDAQLRERVHELLERVETQTS